ncbi:MAG: hypothetical protein M0Q13_07130 [Methanothrix sp.]|jgi:hypothetical protein|nr:hypothetical protein [Methanothrix sp.]
MKKSLICNSSFLSCGIDHDPSEAIKECGFGFVRSEEHNLNDELINIMKNVVKKYNGDRKISENRLKKLKSEFSKRNIIPFQWALAYKKNDNKSLKEMIIEYGPEIFVRLNGKHSSISLVDFLEYIKQSKNSNLKANINIFEYENNKGLANLYSTYDAIFSGRNSSEIAEAIKASNEYIDKKIDSKEFKAIAYAINFAFGITYKVLPKERFSVVSDNEKFSLFFNEILKKSSMVYKSGKQGKSKSAIHNRGFGRSIFEIFLEDEKAAIEFTNCILKPSYYDEDKICGLVSPIYAIRQLLADVVENRINYGKTLGNGNQTAPYYQVACYTMLAFNYWQEGQFIKSLEISEKIKKMDGNDKGSLIKLPYKPKIGITSEERERKFKIAHKELVEQIHGKTVK